MLGVIGGMGPLATADFFRKLIEATPAASDEQHIPTLIHSVPQLPSRPAAILRSGASPLPKLREARDRLLRAGATLLAMPCNTAHHWYDELTADCAVPFVHIVDAACAQAARRVPAGATLGLIATEATLVAEIYPRRAADLGYRWLAPTPEQQRDAVLPAIAEVKLGDLQAAGRRLEPVLASLAERGAAAVVLACTETPLALDAIGSVWRERCIDTNAALAAACVEKWEAMQAGSQFA
ncbi:MAG: amino acid racemase [Burkholderiales bacterium]|jgi:aspartate racemase|nr:amino acid racemase [Burkholderiales bacterium]